jgi:hypothetical protein
MTMHVVPEVEVHPDLSVSRRQPAWIHRTPVSPIVVRTNEMAQFHQLMNPEVS